MIRTSLRICLTLMALLASATTSFALPNCPTDQTKQYHNCFGTYTFSDGNKYVGEWQDNKKNGQGTYTYYNGEKYVGEWKDGKKNGQGNYTFADGDKYVGEWKDSKHSGQGTYTFANGEKYVGEWKDGKNSGHGTYTFPNGQKYVGEWRNDKKNGQGTYTFPSGDKYVGEYKDGKRHGQGFYIWKNGKADFCVYVDDKDSNCSGSNVYNVAPTLTDKFRQLSKSQRKAIQTELKSMALYSSTIDGKWGYGTFSGLASYAALNLKTVNINNYSAANTLFQKIMGSNSPSAGTCPTDQTKRYHNCFGTYTFSDGNEYVGEWQDNKKHGQGTYTYSNGEKYVGEWKDGKKNGQGNYTFADGDKYVGEWRDGKHSGQGTYTFSSGEKYVGEWRDGKNNGQGTYTFPSGEQYVGEYKDNKRNGQGTFTFADGDKYVGEWQDDKKSGQGTYTFANGNKYVGGYKDNKRNGQGIYTFADGTIEEGTWKDGDFLNAQASPKVVETDNPNETREVASGTGFYVSDEGHIITNYHVIDGCMDMKVHTKGRVIPTLRIADDKQNDLALLKISETPSHVFALSNDSPFPLQEIVVAGFPFGESYSSSLKFTQGIVSSLTGIGNNYSEMQIDAALQPGNSGGPIIDEYGNIVGVAVAKLDAKYTIDNFGVIPENTNFGIKASAARNLLEGNQVPLKTPNTDLISRRDISRLATDGTVYLTCWMTSAQLELMKSKKVMFGNLD